jgi:glyoxylase-like metal-dependent hydrolase (beta-lactamase superfamily II)
LKRAKRTFGDFIGEMRKIEDEAFQLIEPSEHFEKGIDFFNTIATYEVNDHEIKLALLKTPGHTPDHQCPVFIKDGNIDFIFYGEAVGTIYHSTKLTTMPTSMPIYFNYEDYMDSLRKLKQIPPELAGFGHFGVVFGKSSVKRLLLEHESLMKEFKAQVMRYYHEKPETKYVVEKILPWLKRTDLIGDKHPLMNNLILGIVYGMLMDLGYRKS